MSQASSTGGDPTPGKPTPSDDRNDVVITPAGPAPKENVHPVKPGEKVRRNDDGRLEIVPADKHGSERQ